MKTGRGATPGPPVAHSPGAQLAGGRRPAVGRPPSGRRNRRGRSRPGRQVVECGDCGVRDEQTRAGVVTLPTPITSARYRARRQPSRKPASTHQPAAASPLACGMPCWSMRLRSWWRPAMPSWGRSGTGVTRRCRGTGTAGRRSRRWSGRARRGRRSRAAGRSARRTAPGAAGGACVVTPQERSSASARPGPRSRAEAAECFQGGPEEGLGVVDPPLPSEPLP